MKSEFGFGCLISAEYGAETVSSFSVRALPGYRDQLFGGLVRSDRTCSRAKERKDHESGWADALVADTIQLG